MSEDPAAYTIPPTPEPEAPARTTRPYLVTLFGKNFAVVGANRDNVLAHVIRRARKEAIVTLADFEDGQFCARNNIELETAGQNENGELFADGGQ